MTDEIRGPVSKQNAEHKKILNESNPFILEMEGDSAFPQIDNSESINRVGKADSDAFSLFDEEKPEAHTSSNPSPDNKSLFDDDASVEEEDELSEFRYVEPKNPFATGLPKWTLEPPSTPVLRKN